SMQRTLNKLLDHFNDDKISASVDMTCFDPKEITVTVKDGKVKVFAKHKEKHSTKEGKEQNYRKIMKEMSLPEGVRKDKVTYSL
ncbi:ODFP1 protein, partial [Geococcyx californianus]|nr:ODFP1 protein [Geococcyx californianus]